MPLQGQLLVLEPDLAIGDISLVEILDKYGGAD